MLQLQKFSITKFPNISNQFQINTTNIPKRHISIQIKILKSLQTSTS